MWKGRILFLFVFMLSCVFLHSFADTKGENETDQENTVYMIKMKKEILASDFNTILDKHGF